MMCRTSSATQAVSSVAADTSSITDAKSKATIEEYDSYAKDGKLSYYPDYAASNLTDAVPAEFR